MFSCVKQNYAKTKERTETLSTSAYHPNIARFPLNGSSGQVSLFWVSKTVFRLCLYFGTKTAESVNGTNETTIVTQFECIQKILIVISTSHLSAGFEFLKLLQK